MTPKYGVGDNVIVHNSNNDAACAEIPKSPGVIVGYIVAYPDHINDDAWIVGPSEVLLVPSVYGVREVLPEGASVGAWAAKVLSR